MLESLYNKAETTNADIVVFSYKLHDDLKLLENIYCFNTEVLKGVEVFSYKDIPNDIFKIINSIVTTKLYKKSFVINSKLEFQALRT